MPIESRQSFSPAPIRCFLPMESGWRTPTRPIQQDPKSTCSHFRQPELSIRSPRRGGVDPLWSPDGTHLFYLNLNERQIVSVNVQTESGFKSGKGNALPIQGLAGGGPRRYDITPDGMYFVIMSPASPVGPGNAKRDQINVVLNWMEELKQRVPVK